MRDPARRGAKPASGSARHPACPFVLLILRGQTVVRRFFPPAPACLTALPRTATSKDPSGPGAFTMTAKQKLSLAVAAALTAAGLNSAASAQVVYQDNFDDRLTLS